MCPVPQWLILPLLLGLKHKPCYSFPQKAQSLRTLIVPVAGQKLPLEPPPLKFLPCAEPSTAASQGGPFGADMLMGLAKADPSYGDYFMINFMRP